MYSEYLEAPMQVSNRVAVWSSALYALSQSLSFWVIGLIFWLVSFFTVRLRRLTDSYLLFDRYGARQLASGAVSQRDFFVAMIR